MSPSKARFEAQGNLPDWNSAVVLLLAAPLARLFGVWFSTVISSRVKDIRSAQQVGALVILPLLAMFLLGQTRIRDTERM